MNAAFLRDVFLESNAKEELKAKNNLKRLKKLAETVLAIFE